MLPGDEPPRECNSLSPVVSLRWPRLLLGVAGVAEEDELVLLSTCLHAQEILLHVGHDRVVHLLLEPPPPFDRNRPRGRSSFCHTLCPLLPLDSPSELAGEAGISSSTAPSASRAAAGSKFGCRILRRVSGKTSRVFAIGDLETTNKQHNIVTGYYIY